MQKNSKEKAKVPNLRFPGFEEEWSEIKIGEILIVGSGKDYKHLTEGETPVFGTGGYMTSVDDYLYNGETVCIGRKGTINKPFYFNGKLWTVDTLFYTHSFKNSIPKFVFYAFEQINWLKYNEASGVPSLSKKTIEQIKVVIPKIEEQKRISKLLSLIDERIQTQNKIVKELKALIKSFRDGVFKQELEFNNKKNSDWEMKKLSDFCTFYSGGTPKSTNKSYYQGNIPFIGSGNISDDFVTNFITEEALKSSSAKLVEKGDLLYALYGATSGEVAVSKISGAINQAVLCIRTNENKLYLHHVLKHNKDKIVQTYIQGGQGNLSAKIVKELSFNLPPLKEQNRIATFLSAIDTKIRIEKSILKQFEKQKKYLLQNLFI